MPYWMPRKRTLEDDIIEEQAKLARIWQKEVAPQQIFAPRPVFQQEQPMFERPMFEQPLEQQWQPQQIMEQQWQPPQMQMGVQTPQTPVRPLISQPIQAPPMQQAPPLVPIEEEVYLPFWKKALQVFAAPFEWIDQNLIKPGLGLVGTGLDFVEEVPREPGEDFWEWKKRSWAGWESPGIDVKVPWSEDSLRLDLRGVMELAPWLLIPGAGQVGGATGLGARIAGKAGTRVARGVSGIAGKAGLPGRILGTAVEYSPWGLVEKTAGVAIKGGIRVAGKVSERVSTEVGERLFGKYVPPPIPPEVKKLTQYFKEVVMPARKEFKKLVPEKVTARQEAAVQEVFGRYRRGEITYSEMIEQATKARGGGIKGEFALTPEALAVRQAKAITEVEARVASGEFNQAVGKALITKLRKSPAYTAVPFEETEVKKLIDMIIDGTESGLVRVNSADAFLELLTQGKLPFPYNIRDWAKVFGDDFAKAVGKLARTPGISGSQLVDALNLPRAVLASTDLSATLRQGLILSLLRPTKTPVWFGRQIKSLISEKLALELDDALRTRPLFKEFVKSGGYIAPMKHAIPTKAEELFMSDFARRIPLIRRSERAFITYLNEARMATFEAAHSAMTAQGATPAHFKILADFINMASGRGTLPKSLEKYSPVLNTILFSPRLQAATLQLPRQIGRMLLSGNPYMRKEAAKALITFVGGGSVVLGLLKATGNKVELDPRAGDFGKVIIGETRLDIWRGYLQYSRFAAQMLTGERKSAYGNMNKTQRSEIASRFLQSKSSPAFGLMVDLLRGENYMGRPIFDDTAGFSRAVMERVLPLAIQDTIDAMEQSGMNGLWVAAPVTLGIGALTYVNDLVRVKERIAREMGYQTWDEIDPKTQREIQNRNVELQTAYLDFDRQVMGTAWGDWRNAGAAIEDVFGENVDLATAQYRATGDGYIFREKIGKAFEARSGGYAAREKETRFEDIVSRLNIEDTAESLALLGPEQLAIKTYNDALWGDDMYDEFGDYRFDAAELRKEQLRESLGEVMYDYVEEYRGLKYEDFPPEYQELVQAKIALRPYWKIKTQIEEMFGKFFAESSKGKALITKLRKQLKLQNPEMARYIELFYTR